VVETISKSRASVAIAKNLPDRLRIKRKSE
jgi:hypothetical protein